MQPAPAWPCQACRTRHDSAVRVASRTPTNAESDGSATKLRSRGRGFTPPRLVTRASSQRVSAHAPPHASLAPVGVPHLVRQLIDLASLLLGRSRPKASTHAPVPPLIYRVLCSATLRSRSVVELSEGAALVRCHQLESPSLATLRAAADQARRAWLSRSVCYAAGRCAAHCGRAADLF